MKKSDPLDVDLSANAPRSRSSFSANFLARLSRLILNLLGWRFSGGIGNYKKIMLVVAPHRSNWDWIIGLCFVWGLRVKFSYLIKQSVMVWPLSAIVRKTGGVPVGIADQVVNFFNERDSLYFAITPEGTRKEVTRWKSGFLRIAYSLELPVIPAFIDYKNKQVQILDQFELDGEIDSDILKVQKYFQDLEANA